MTINTEKELENVSGGSPFANGSYVDYDKERPRTEVYIWEL